MRNPLKTKKKLTALAPLRNKPTFSKSKSPYFLPMVALWCSKTNNAAKNLKEFTPPEIGYIFVHQGVRETIYQKRNTKKGKWFAPIEEQTT